ncbi:hypothetical protein RB608_12035 [Nocardioides sp. LHD-245]|uniref:hypothetical protein n=1 Tax=Nocardioides sp. LHD-245 TaxID=3051387 RepID=UPI0027E2149E|nr:hypothetical protein [Nocardioides sp. LHD-245]
MSTATTQALRQVLADEFGITSIPEHERGRPARRFPVECRSDATRREIADALPAAQREALLYKADVYGLDLDGHDVIEVLIPSWAELAPGSRTQGFDYWLRHVVKRVPVGYSPIGRGVGR